jgi:hypothetical protein
MVGPADDPGLADYTRLLAHVAGGLPAAERLAGLLGPFRREAARLPDPQINDQPLTPPEDEARRARTKGMRLLGPRRLPSAVLFQNTVHPAVRGRMFPSGIDVLAAGPLACEAGRRALRKSVPDAATADAILRADCGPLGDSLHGRAMQLLPLLQRPLPASAPAPLRTPAWQDKQLSTSLAVWAEERHTWALQAKITLNLLGGTTELPGYVCPYPEFYRGLGRLARHAAGVLSDAAGDGPDLAAAGRAWLALQKKEDARPVADWPARADFFPEGAQQEQVYDAYFAEQGRKGSPAGFLDYARAREELRQSARRCAERKGVTGADRRRMAAFLREPGGEGLKLLPEFAALCDRLAAIAQKELEGKPLDERDARFIAQYGETLARFHFYNAEAYLVPRDDFPQVVPVFVNPYASLGETLYAGVGRPEAIYVILSDGKRQVLHRGAVLGYREFLRPIGQPLDDEKWTEEVRSGTAPPPLPLTASFRQGITEREVAALIRAGKPCPNPVMPGREITRAMIDVIGRADLYKSYPFYELLGERITGEDVPALLERLPQVPPDEMSDASRCLTRAGSKLPRDRLYALLGHDRIAVADAIACALAQRPKEIDAGRLADAYGRRAPFAQRLCCYLIGQSQAPGRRGEQVLLAALGDTSPGLRYEAASAVAVCRAGSPEIAAKIAAGIEDENSCVAAAMAHAAVKLGAKQAAAKMLARLKAEPLVQPESSTEERRDRTAVIGGAGA